MSDETPKPDKPARKAKPAAAKPAAAKPAAEAPDATASAAPAAEGAAPEASTEKKEVTAASLLGDDIGEIKVRRAKGSKNIIAGVCHILATFNNTKVTITAMVAKHLSQWPIGSLTTMRPKPYKV
jgi:small subunit ribosomal protein S11